MDGVAEQYNSDAGTVTALAENVCTPEVENDPLWCKVPLPHRVVFYPLGFPVEIATNSQDVLDAAAESWGSSRQRHNAPALQLRVGVADAGPEECPPAPIVRAQRHLLSIIANSHNQAICDVREGFAFVWINRGSISHRSYLRYHFLESVALTLIATSRATPLHAGCVSRYGRGVLLCGASGAGKSSLAYACACAGWTYTSDDASYLLRDAGHPRVIGNSGQFRFRPSARAIFPELHGHSLTPRAQGKPSIEIPTSDLPQVVTAENATVHYAIFLNREPSFTAAELRIFSKDAAMEYFRENVYPIEEVGWQQAAALECLSGIETYELCYKDLNQAVEHLDRLARGDIPPR